MKISLTTRIKLNFLFISFFVIIITIVMFYFTSKIRTNTFTIETKEFKIVNTCIELLKMKKFDAKKVESLLKTLKFETPVYENLKKAALKKDLALIHEIAKKNITERIKEVKTVLHKIQSELDNTEKVLFPVFLVVFITLVTIGYIGTSEIKKPFKKFKEIIDKVKHGNFEARIPLVFGSDFNSVAMKINNLLDTFQAFDRLKEEKIKELQWRFNKIKYYSRATILVLNENLEILNFYTAYDETISDTKEQVLSLESFNINDEVKNEIKKMVYATKPIDGRRVKDYVITLEIYFSQESGAKTFLFILEKK